MKVFSNSYRYGSIDFNKNAGYGKSKVNTRWIHQQSLKEYNIKSKSYGSTVIYLNTKAVVRGSRIFITTPLNLEGLYSEYLVLQYMSNNFNSQPKLTVEMQFLKYEKITSI